MISSVLLLALLFLAFVVLYVRLAIAEQDERDARRLATERRAARLGRRP